jgi:hypothetical protein
MKVALPRPSQSVLLVEDNHANALLVAELIADRCTTTSGQRPL